MLIDIPVTIIFDCEATDFRSIEAAAGCKICCTLRYDTDNDGSDALLIHNFPPQKYQHKYAESGQPLLAYIPSGADKKIKERAERNPYDYLASTFTEDERQAAQDKVDAERDQTP